MKIVLVSVRESRPIKSREMDALATVYLERSTKYTSCAAHVVGSEIGLWAWVEKQSGRTIPVVMLLDSSGTMMSSKELARRLGVFQEQDTQLLVLAIGPADGWSERSLKRATETLSLGPMTLPHELARVVVAEQIYRALTILAGHPYHSGH